jgi:hypothetical protein
VKNDDRVIIGENIFRIREVEPYNYLTIFCKIEPLLEVVLWAYTLYFEILS